ncbi:hypothetical protein [Streptomyces sp. NPDC048419]|uniref:hypothetical protein n=1 Tax=Streptomyces sp. NPDC048419 TaxID=3365547 RepID=UPI0037118921
MNTRAVVRPVATEAQLGDDSYRFGRIVKLGEGGPQDRFPSGVLAYDHRAASQRPVPEFAALTSDRSLMPPFFTMNWVWHKGYFRTVAHEELNAGHLHLLAGGAAGAAC